MLKLQHYVAIVISIIILFVLYFGFDLVPKDQKKAERSRSLSIEATSVQNLILDAKKELGPEFGVIEALNMELNEENNDSLRVDKLKNLSSNWYELGFPAISAYYAEEVADIKQDEEAWSIAGTTYLIALKESEEEKTKTWSFNRAIRAFENAISQNPKNLDHRINLALTYIEKPLPEDPMKGILLLRELNQQNPESVKVLAQLGRLSLTTNQIDNALKRLHQAEEIDPDNKSVLCLLAQAYEMSGDATKAKDYNNKCIN